jgi:hypothetical protein
MPGMSNAGALDAQAEMLMHGCEFGDSQLEASMRERLRARLAEAADERRPLRVYTGTIRPLRTCTWVTRSRCGRCDGSSSSVIT